MLGTSLLKRLNEEGVGDVPRRAASVRFPGAFGCCPNEVSLIGTPVDCDIGDLLSARDRRPASHNRTGEKEFCFGSGSVCEEVAACVFGT